jgi:hypothetical protein
MHGTRSQCGTVLASLCSMSLLSHPGDILFEGTRRPMRRRHSIPSLMTGGDGEFWCFVESRDNLSSSRGLFFFFSILLLQAPALRHSITGPLRPEDASCFGRARTVSVEDFWCSRRGWRLRHAGVEEQGGGTERRWEWWPGKGDKERAVLRQTGLFLFFNSTLCSPVSVSLSLPLLV